MATVSISLRQVTQVTSNDNGASYQVTNVVESARGIDRALFVYRTDTQRFDHYATPADLVAIPTSLDLAMANRLPFFRQENLTRSWPNQELMQADVAVTEARLRDLAREVSARGSASVIDKVIEIEVG